MRLIKAARFKRMPWKNGGGETVEIAVHPPGADLANFDWRVSTATVANDGDFSAFDGIDRTLCLLSGAGMEVHIAGLGRHRLTTASAPLSFPADVATQARLTDGPITDLNVMTRRFLFRHRVERLEIRETTDINCTGRWNVVVIAGPIQLAGPSFQVEAEAGDAFLSEGRHDLRLSARRPTTAFSIAITAE